MPFRQMNKMSQAILETGAIHFSFVHKTSTPAAIGAGYWVDTSMSAGTPKFNAYVGGQLEATPMVGAGNFGIYTGGNVEPSATKHIYLTSLESNNANIHPSTFLLLDYLMFYPLIDMDSTDEQPMENITALPRYADGNGVRLMLVCTIPQTANAVMTIGYTNTDDVPQTTTLQIGAANVGGIQGGQQGVTAGRQSPFAPLAGGDMGVKQVNSVQMNSGSGGFCALVLVKPILQTGLYQVGTPLETVHFTDQSKAPRVFDGAYLNYIFQSTASGASGLLRGRIEFVWG